MGDALSRADSVAAIVVGEPDANVLLPYVDTAVNLPPPQNVAERVWTLLVRDIIPHTAHARTQLLESRYRAVPYAEFQLMRLVAETCQIDGFCLADLRRASRARWAYQLSQVNAFLAFRKSALEEYGAGFAEIRQLELAELDAVSQKEELMRRLAPRQGQREERQAARMRTAKAISDLQVQVDALSSEVVNLEADNVLASQELDRLRAELASAEADLLETRRKMGGIRPILARGADKLETDLAAVDRRIETLRSAVADAHAQGAALGLAGEALAALSEDITRMVELKTQSVALRSEEQALESRLGPLRQRLEQLTQESVAASTEYHEAEAESADLQSRTDLAKQQVDELNSRLAQAARQLDALEAQSRHSLEQLENEHNAALHQLQDVEATVRSREQWLADFHTAETASTVMEGELALLHDWGISTSAKVL